MQERYDVIVIGTGCGGAAAAALAAYYGHQTLILEKNKIVGGRAATLEKNGLKMDHGHVLLRCDKGPHGKVLKMVKCRDLIPKFSYAYDWGIKPVCGDVVNNFPPHRRRIFLPFIGLLELMKYRFTLKELMRFNLFFTTIILMPQRMIKKYDQVDLKTFMAKFSDNRYFQMILGGIVTVSMGSTLDQVSAGEVMRVLKSGYLDLISIGYPVTGEGIAAIPKSFLRAAQRYGAELELNAPVEKIVVENNTAKGVIVDGRLIKADIVISNAGINETVFKLVGEDKFEPPYAEKISNLKYSYAGLSLKYVLDKPITEYAWGGEVPENFEKITHDMSAGKVPERLPWMFVATTNIDSSLAQDGQQLISVISGGCAAQPGTVDWRVWTDKVKEQVDEYFPQLKEHVVRCYEASPDDIARFSGRKYGDAVGVAQTVDQVGDLRPSPVSPIKGLFYAGADVGRNNIATEMATQSAIALAPYLNKNNKSKRLKVKG